MESIDPSLSLKALVEQNFMISRQIRDEILPVFYKKHWFSFDSADQDLNTAADWLQNLQPEQLRLVQNVHVQVDLEESNLPLEWMEAEEEISKKCVGPLNITIDFSERLDRDSWILAYSKCWALRAAGATWDQIREQEENIREEIDEQLYADDVLYADADEEGHDSGSDDDDNDSDEEMSEDEAMRQDNEDFLEAWAETFAPEIVPILQDLR